MNSENQGHHTKYKGTSVTASPGEFGSKIWKPLVIHNYLCSNIGLDFSTILIPSFHICALYFQPSEDQLDSPLAQVLNSQRRKPDWLSRVKVCPHLI
jgi:hypothetical protein